MEYLPLRRFSSSKNTINFDGILACCYQMRACKSGKTVKSGCMTRFTITTTYCVISFLKDLATLRSPQSPLTFLAYLYSQNRLVAFINRGCTIPTRKEYADYLAWAAQFVQDRGVAVKYGEEVIGLRVGQDDTIEVCSRVLGSSDEIVRRARMSGLHPFVQLS